MKRFFSLEYWKDDGWYVGKLNKVPGVFSQGKTLDELKENIVDAYHMVIICDEESPRAGRLCTVDLKNEQAFGACPRTQPMQRPPDRCW